VTDPDPNETARMPTPADAGPTPTEGWPGSTEVSSSPAATGPAPAASAPADAAPAPPPAIEAPADPAPPTPPAWSTPPAVAPKRRQDPDRGRSASIVFGLVMLAIGGWFFAEQTLGLDLPPIRWSQFWPVILIGLGVWIVLGSMRRGSR
jgi:uncharacterized membrane protein